VVIQESVTFSSDDDDSEDEMDPEEREILAAFYEYGVEVSSSSSPSPTAAAQQNPQIATATAPALTTDINLSSMALPKPLMIPLRGDLLQSTELDADRSTPAYLPMQSIRPALIQITNTIISEEMIRSELQLMGLAVDQTECIYLSEFVSLYRRIAYRLNPGALSMPNDDKYLHSSMSFGYDHDHDDDHELDVESRSPIRMHQHPQQLQASDTDELSFCDDESLASIPSSSIPQGAAIQAIRSVRK
jgi:hypothetical protein